MQAGINLNPNEPFEYSFLDEDFQKNYEAENRLAAIVGYFTVIAILISCLGFVWSCHIQRRATHKRNWCKQSIGSKR